MARIVCISDLHLGSSDSKGIYGESMSSRLTDSIGTDKRKLLCEALKCLTPKADIIVFCGDFVTGRDSANDIEKEYDDFVELLNEINECAIDIFPNDLIPVKNRIIIAPGNHDVTRDENQDALHRFKNKLSEYITPFYRDTLNPITKHAPIFIFDNLKLIVACMSTVDNSATPNEEVKALLSMVKSEKDVSDELKEKLTKYLEKNTFCDIPTLSEDSRMNFMKKNQTLGQDKYKDYTRMIVTHHPLISGIEHGRTIKTYNYTVGGFEFLEQALPFDYSIFVHGHMHEFTCVQFNDYIVQENQDREGVQVGVPALKVNEPGAGVVIIDTNEKDEETKIILMKLDDVSCEFKQQNYIDYVKSNEHLRSGIPEISHILVDREIEKLVQEQKVIKEGDIRHIEAASYDCSLGYFYKKISHGKKDELLQLESKDGKPAEIKIAPNETVLIYTYEKFDIPDDMLLHASPIASLIRKGLRTQISHFVDPGFVGEFCFTVTNESNSDVTITAREPIISIEIVKLHNKVNKTWKDRHPEKVRMREERNES